MKTTRPLVASLRDHLAGKQPYLLLALVVLVVDQWTKHLIESRLAGQPPLQIVPGMLDFTYVRNTGVAFGLFPAGGSLVGMILLSLLGFAGFALLAYYFLHAPRQQRLLLASLGLVLGGAVGNLADRVASGAVTDFVDLYYRGYHWYTFNVADSAITVGIVLMTAELFLPSRHARTDEVRREEAETSESPPRPAEQP